MTKTSSSHGITNCSELVRMTGFEAIETLKHDWLDFCDTGLQFSFWAGDVLPIFESAPSATYEFDGEITLRSIKVLP